MRIRIRIRRIIIIRRRDSEREGDEKPISNIAMHLPTAPPFFPIVVNTRVCENNQRTNMKMDRT